MADLGTAYVQIVPSAKGISGNIQKALAPEAASAGNMAGTAISQTIGQKMSSIGGKFLKAGAIATAVSVPIISGIKSSLAAYEVQATAETKLTEIYKSRMGVSKKAAQATMTYASELQKTGVIGDEVALSGAQQLATFAKYPKTINTLMPAMENLLAQQNGMNSTASDAVNIGNLMGKVMQGQTGALKRVGVSFTEAQEQVLKYGTEEEKAAMLAEVINDNVGNMNETLAKTPAGRIQQMKNTMGDLSEQIGGILAPTIQSLAEYVSANVLPKIQTALDFIGNHPALGKLAAAIVGIMVVAGPLLMMIGTFMTVMSAVSLPILAVVAAIAAAVAIGVLLYKNWDKIKATALKVWETIKAKTSAAWTKIKTSISNAINGALNTVQETVANIKDRVHSVWENIKQKTVAIWTAIKTAISDRLKSAVSSVKSLGGKIKSAITTAWNAVKSGTSAAWARVKNAITSPITAAASRTKTVVHGIRSALGNAWNTIKSKAAAAWKTIKEKIVQPIEDARDKVKSAIDKIKSFFPLSIGKIFSNLKLPHFSVSGGSPPFGIGGKGSLPHMSVSWYKKAEDQPYMFGKGARLFGAGDASDEIMYGRRNLMRDISAAVKDTGNGPTYNIGDVTLEVSKLEDVATLEEIVTVFRKAKAFV